MAQRPPPEAKPLPSPPTDGISALSYLPQKSSHLASTSWDGNIRIHDTNEMTLLVSNSMESGPLLSLAMSMTSNDVIYTGGLDGYVRKFDIPSSTTTVVGSHSSSDKKGCSCLTSVDGSLLASAGWDGQFHLWDVRTTSGPVATVDLPGKAFSMDYDVNHHRVVVATAGRRTCFLDVRGGASSKIALERESSLKYQTRCIRFFPKGDGVALGSIEGRVGIEFLDDLGVPAPMKPYAFKCHRVGDTVYPVNCIAFHPKFGTFATGGCDGTVILWDGMAKKKLASLPKFPTSIAALAFNHDGSQLAIASSYTFEEGEREHPHDEIYVREMLESECAPKAAAM